MLPSEYSEKLLVAQTAMYFMDFVEKDKLQPIEATVRLHALFRSMTDECNRRLTYHFKEMIEAEERKQAREDVAEIEKENLRKYNKIQKVGRKDGTGKN